MTEIAAIGASQELTDVQAGSAHIFQHTAYSMCAMDGWSSFVLHQHTAHSTLHLHCATMQFDSHT